MKKEKSNALYPHPFSKAYWRDAASELKDVRMLVIAALLIALRVALKLVAIPLAPNLKINTAFLANAMGAMIYGPVVAIPAAFISDFLGVLLTGDAYFLPFCLTEIAGSVIFALFLYRADLTPTRVMLSRFCICLFVNILLQTPIMVLYYKIVLGKTTYALTVPQILKNLFMFPVESVLLTLFLKMISPITYRMGLTYDSEASLKFDKKQTVTLAALFLVGAVSVFAYLNYHFKTNSLSADYSAEERYEKNCAMTQIVDDNTDEHENQELVATIESAYRKFLSSEITYNCSVYAVNGEALEGYEKSLDEIRGMSKSKAKAVAEDGIMERFAGATVVIDSKSGEILSCTFTD